MMISSQDIRPVLATTAAIAALLIGSRSGWCLPSYITRTKMKNTKEENNSKNDEQNSDDSDEDEKIEIDLSVLPCIRNRRSIFPNSYRKNPITKIKKSIIQSLLDAALWSPFHGNCYKDSHHPAQFVILGKESMDKMQQLSLDYYDKNWKKVGWPGSSSSCTDDNNTEEEYMKWRNMTEDEITNRWKPVEYMIAIIMRRQSTPTKRFPEWEELAAVATSVQNIHIQACTRFPQLACYWSSWHSAARDSIEMKQFLKLKNINEDKCMGFFIIAQKDPTRCSDKDRRKRDNSTNSLMSIEWRE